MGEWVRESTFSTVWLFSEWSALMWMRIFLRLLSYQLASKRVSQADSLWIIHYTLMNECVRVCVCGNVLKWQNIKYLQITLKVNKQYTSNSLQRTAYLCGYFLTWLITNNKQVEPNFSPSCCRSISSHYVTCFFVGAKNIYSVNIVGGVVIVLMFLLFISLRVPINAIGSPHTTVCTLFVCCMFEKSQVL